MAFNKFSRPTISIRNDCRAGTSNALTVPSSVARTMISHTLPLRICPLSVSAASVKASSMEMVCVPITTRRRGQRSATSPASGERRKMGICPTNPSKPKSTDEPVRR